MIADQLCPRKVQVPRTVVALGATPNACVAIESVVGTMNFEVVKSVAEACVRLTSLPDACFVFAVPHKERNGYIDDLLQLRGDFPLMPMLALYYPSTSSCSALLTLGAAGVRHTVTAEPVLREQALKSAFLQCYGETLAVRVWKWCNLDIPEPHVALTKAALRLAHSPISAKDFASYAGMHERSLRKYCAREGLPSPRWIIGWARLLTASYFLVEPGRTVSNVAELVGYPSACALRNQLLRYSGITPRTLRMAGTSQLFACALERFDRARGSRSIARSSEHFSQR